MLGRLAIALAIAVAALPIPAGAQFFGSNNYYGQRPNRPPPSRGFFSFPLFGNPGGGDQYNPFYRPAPPPVESYKPPPPRKLETPPTTTVMVIGDTMADWLAYGLEDVLSDTPDVGVVRNIRPTSGLIRYDAKNDSLEWSGIVKDALVNEKPSAIVIMLGLNDRLPFRDKVPPKSSPQAAQAAQPQAQSQNQDKTAPADAAKPDGEQPSVAASEPPRQGPPGSYDFHTDKWAELYAKRVDDMIAALKSKGVPVLWVGLPAVYGTKSTSDMSYLDEIFRARAERAGIIYVDIWDGFVDESGRYVTQGPDFEGQIRRLRTGDGVHFTKFGAVKLAQYVAQDLRRVMSSHVVPVALPAPEGAPAKPGAGPRPAVGPVLPLTADTSVDGNNLLGDGGRTAPANADPDGGARAHPRRSDPGAVRPRRRFLLAAPRQRCERRGGAGARRRHAVGAAAKRRARQIRKRPTTPSPTPRPRSRPPPRAGRTARRPSASLDGGPPRPPAPVGRGF